MSDPDNFCSIRGFPVGSLTGPARVSDDYRPAQGDVGLTVATGIVVRPVASRNHGGAAFPGVGRGKELLPQPGLSGYNRGRSAIQKSIFPGAKDFRAGAIRNKGVHANGVCN
jgi:hypothetical protein